MKRLLARSCAILTVLLAMVSAVPGRAAQAGPEGIYRLDNGIVLPYPLGNLFRGYSACHRGIHKHKALDIGGVGPDAGLGSPIRAVGRSLVLSIGTPEMDPARFGRRDTRGGKAERGRQMLPRSREIPGYGRVRFFTLDYGTARTGVWIRTKVLEGRLKGFTVSYMHLAAVNPEVKVGQVVEGGQEIGLLGGTAVQESSPHLHLSFQRPSGRLADIGPIFGIGRTFVPCRSSAKKEAAIRARYQEKARELMARLAHEGARIHIIELANDACGKVVREGDFADKAHDWREVLLPEREGPLPVTIRYLAEGRWRPQLELRDRYRARFLDGNKIEGSKRRRWSLKLKADGRRDKRAEVSLVVPAGQRLAVRATWWGNPKPPKGSRWTLEVELPCP